MSKTPVNKQFVSEADEFLAEMRKQVEQTPAQIEEVNKHAKIAKLRDEEQADQESGDIWSGF